MLTTAFAYSILMCASSFGVNFDRSIVLPGNKSFTQTEKCELRYDKNAKWSQGYVEATIHIQNNCGDFVPCDNYDNDIKVKTVISINKCNVSSMTIGVDPNNNISLDWLKNEMIPVVRQNIQSAFQKQLNIAVQYVPSFRKSCE
jgi:hypothetical protein